MKTPAMDTRMLLYADYCVDLPIANNSSSHRFDITLMVWAAYVRNSLRPIFLVLV